MTSGEFESWLQLFPRRPLVMGVLNVTPDSFSDGGKFDSPRRALDLVARMLSEGADMIDVGAESTRPGASAVPEAEQIRRLEPVLRGLQPSTQKAVFSIDTTRAAVVEMAAECGFVLANDVSAGRDDPTLLPTVARLGMNVCLMHMLCTPATMQDNPRYNDVSHEVGEFLRSRTQSAINAGVPRHRILVDPGIGFGKTDAHNLELLRNLRDLTAIGQPILVGTSRKGFIGRITHEPEPRSRQYGTAATVCWCIANGCDVVRVHDVKAMRQVVDMTMAIKAKDA